MKFKLLTVITIATLFAVSCKKDFLDVNTSPNSLTGTISPSFVFTNALSQTVRNMVDQNEIGSYYAGHWTQSSSYIYSSTTFSYQFTNSNFNFYDPMYNNLQDYQYVIDNSDVEGQPFFKGPAKVMKAMIFQQLVDLYGNVPYSQALKGLGSLSPAFDDQKAIYENLTLLLDSALVDLKANAFTGTFGNADVAFRGNTTNWARFANSLKLRILIRQSRVSGREGYITTEIKKAVAEGSGFIGANMDVSVNPGYLASDGKQNPMYDRWAYSPSNAVRSLGRYPRATKYLFDNLKETNDTFRLKRLAYARGGEGSTPGVSLNPEIVANYVGVPFGIGSGFTAGTASAIGPSVFVRGQFNKPLYLMTASESQFLLSEAVLLYGMSLGLTNTAQQYYEQGVKESFRLVGATQAQATILLTSGKAEADWMASTDKFKALWRQKWLSFVNFLGQEAWSEVRRTNHPPIPISASVPVGTTPAVRLFYPNTELGSNGKNVLAQGTIDIKTSRIFWDVD